MKPAKNSIGVAIAASIITVVLTMAYIGYAEGKSFRERPRQSAFQHIFNGNTLASYIARAIALKEGTNAYQAMVLRFLAISDVRQDSVNRFLLTRHASGLNDSEFFDGLRWITRHLDNYGEQLERRLFDPGDDSCQIFTQRYAARALSELNRPSFQEKLMDCIIAEYDSGTPGNISGQSASYLDAESDRAQQLFGLVVDTPFNVNSIELLGRFSLSRRVHIRSGLLSYFQEYTTFDNANAIDVVRLLQIVWESEDTDSFNAIVSAYLAGADAEQFLSFFREMYRAGLKQWTRFVTKNLIDSGFDSTQRKGAIVTMVNYGEPLGTTNIDLAFSGLAPRTTYFERIRDYMYGSQATDQYIEIARHDYLETGKTFPPTYCLPPLEDEVERWQEFIVSYPWHPANDDAYYRLAARQFYDGDIEDAMGTIENYESQEFADNDSREVMSKLKNEISTVLKGKADLPDPIYHSYDRFYFCSELWPG